MNASTLIKNATKSHQLYVSALQKATAAKKECECILEEALPCVSNVAQAVAIIALSEDKYTITLAWKKAVVLLGTSGRSLPDLLLIKKCGFVPGAKEDDVRRDLKQKESLIVSKTTDEELLFTLYSQGNHWSAEYREGLEAQFGRLAGACSNLQELTTLYNRYNRLNCRVRHVWNQHADRIKQECEEKAAEFNSLAEKCAEVDDLYALYDRYNPWLCDTLNQSVSEHEVRIWKQKEESS